MMGAYFIYLRLELKKACRILPSFLTGAVVLALLLGTIALLGNRALYGESAIGRITVGVVLPQDDIVAKKAVSMISSMESVKSICDFEYLDEEEGRKKLKAGSLYTMMTVPEDFIQSIINGSNLPITISLPDSQSMEAMIFKELTDAGAKTLSIAQAAIYAADEYCTNHGIEEKVPSVEAALNQIYLKYALSRENIFRNEEVAATGDATVIQYYICSAVVLFLLLCGIPVSSILEPQKQVMKQKLGTIGIGRWKSTLARVISVSFLLFLVFSGIIAGLSAADLLLFHAGMLILGMPICLAISAVIVFAYELGGSQIAGVCFLFLSSVVMLFISGGLIPLVFLPKGIQSLSGFMPTSVLMEVMKMTVTFEISNQAVIQMCLMGAGFYGLAAVMRR